MKKIFTLFLGIGLSFSGLSQNLDNTVWSFPPAKVSAIAGLVGGLDSAKMFFDSPDLFHVEFYYQGSFSVPFNGSYAVDELTNTGQIVDSTNGTGFCQPIEVITFDYSVVDTVITLSNIGTQCSVWTQMIPGDYYLDNVLTTNNVSEQSSFDFSMYPNPAKYQINFSEAMELIELFDLSGKRILMLENSFALNLEGLQKGMYQVKVYRENKVAQRKLIIE